MLLDTAEQRARQYSFGLLIKKILELECIDCLNKNNVLKESKLAEHNKIPNLKYDSYGLKQQFVKFDGCDVNCKNLNGF